MEITWVMPKPSELFDEHQKLLKEECLMALRDEFAKAALTGLLSNPAFSEYPTDELAENAYFYADAMMSERRVTDDK